MPKKKKISRASKKLGLPPGSLVYIGDDEKKPTSLELFKFNKTEVFEQTYQSYSEIDKKPDNDHSFWLNVNGIHDAELIGEIAKGFKLDELLVEDIMNATQRPKFDEFPPHLYITLKMLRYNTELEESEMEQVSLVLGENYILSFQEKEGDIFDSIRNRIRTENSNVRNKKSDYVFYRLMDVIVDHYFIITDHIDERLEQIEDKLFNDFEERQLSDIQDVKKSLLHLKRQVIPLKESINTLVIMDSEIMDHDTKKFLKDILDHLNQIADNIESEKDLQGMLMDLYLNRQANETNQVMKVLTIIATIFIPLTFLVGIYGMNFQYMPELSWKYGYPGLIVLMLFMVVAMVYYFRKKKWF